MDVFLVKFDFNMKLSSFDFKSSLEYEVYQVSFLIFFSNQKTLQY